MAHRDTTWDAVKGGGILLMVIGHSGCPEYMHDFIYLFHMGLFFFVSGRFLKINRGGVFLAFVKKKLRGLYFPFVKWSLVYIVLHNVFFKLGWYDSSYTYSEIIFKILKAFTFKDVSEQLIGPMWFLKSLFFGSVITYVVCLISNKKMQMCMVLTLYLVCWFIGRNYLPYLINREMGVVIVIYLGWLLKDSELSISKYMCLVFMTMLLLSAFWVKIDVVGCAWGPIGIFPLLSVVGVILVLNGVRLLKNEAERVYRLLAYLGKFSIYILVFHFTAFHTLSTIIVHFGFGNSDSLSNMTVISGINHNMWFIPYTIIGIFGSLLYQIIKTNIKKYHKNGFIE